jgi:hypothetical protein
VRAAAPTGGGEGSAFHVTPMVFPLKSEHESEGGPDVAPARCSRQRQTRRALPGSQANAFKRGYSVVRQIESR